MEERRSRLWKERNLGWRRRRYRKKKRRRWRRRREREIQNT